MRPMVSVLIPSYNHARFLPECLRSIHEQTYPHWQVVLIDDGSTDDSVAIASSIAVDEPRIRVLSNEANLGTYGTEQQALELSDGAYVAIMNSDDLWAPAKLEKQVAMLEGLPDVPVCYGLGTRIDEDGRVDEAEDVHADWPREPVQDLLPYLLFENRVLASGVLFRRDGLVFDPTLRYSGDWVALLRATAGKKTACLPERLNSWRMHGHNSFRRSHAQLFEEIRVRQAILDDESRWLGLGDERSIREGLAKNANALYFLYGLVGMMPEARACARIMLRAWKNLPTLKKGALTRLPVEFARATLRKRFADEDWMHWDPAETRRRLTTLGSVELGAFV